MDVSMEEVLLKEVASLQKHYDFIAQFSGENFNIFRTLQLESNEVRTHSAILAEFLNPQGSHGQKDRFLKLFTESYKITDFDTSSAKAEVEYYIGPINDDNSKGGRIDILITDKDNKHIIIENKIFAGDQKNQLLRYYNFDHSATIFYLTLFGEYPSDWSTDGKLDKPQIKNISYIKDLVNWFETCKKESVSHPIIRETLSQYIQLINYLTGNSIYKTMENDIAFLIEQNPEYIKSAFTISKSIIRLQEKLILRFIEQLKKIATDRDLEFRNDSFGQAKDSYFTFKLSPSKYNTTILFGFENWFSDFHFGVEIENKDFARIDNEEYLNLKNEISSRLANVPILGRDAAPGKEFYLDWVYLHFFRYPLQNWYVSEVNWIGISDGSLQKQIGAILDQAIIALDGVEY